MKKSFFLALVMLFGVSLSAQKKTEEHKSGSETLAEVLGELGQSLGVLGESMGELGEIMDKYKDKVDEDALRQNADGSWTIHMEGDLEDYMSEKDAAALRRDLESWGDSLERDMEDWSKDFEIEMEKAAERFENWIESIFEDSEVDIDVKTSKDKSSKKKVYKI